MESSELNTGVLGAKVQSFRRISARELLIRVMGMVPNGSRETVLDTFRNELNSSPSRDDLLDGIVEYWFSNHYRSLVDNQRIAPQAARQEKAQRVAEIKTTIDKAIGAKAKIVLLDMIMPNGKKLRNCTGADCKHASGWLGKIAKRIKPTDVIGKVLTEDDLRELHAG